MCSSAADMRIQIVWPEQRCGVTLQDHHHASPLWFNPATGDFTEQGEDHDEQIAFWLQHHQAMIRSDSSVYTLTLNGQLVEPGVIRQIHGGALLQIGHFRLEISKIAADELATTLLPIEEDIPELELLINYGGHYTPYSDEAQQGNPAPAHDDPLKSLTQEYKHYLLWGEQHHIPRDVKPGSARTKPDRLSDTLNLHESVKNKTVSECVISADAMMERIFKELMIDQDDILETDQEHKLELLRELAPEHLKQIEKRAVSELLYRELYKLGLDSHL